MKTLYLDCFAGISGDMAIGALLDLGLKLEDLTEALAKLDVEGYEVSFDRVERSGINAVKFKIAVTTSQKSLRSLSSIQQLIETSSLSHPVKQNATAIFQRLGEAQAKIHGLERQSVQLQEVGAIDAIVGIVGTCVGLEAIGIEQIVASPLHVGSGMAVGEDGAYPIPGPVTTEILRGIPIYAKDIEGEFVTPTGAAVIATLAKDFVKLPLMRVEKVGYGAGARGYEKFPNVLRAVLGEVEEADQTPDTITVIEANLDDLNPQVFGHLMGLALAAGALDIFYTPVQMKKNRPGVLLTMLCAPEKREPLVALIFRETTTLGVRYREERREILRREFVTIETEYGPITIKIARNQTGQIMNASPEFEDCQAAALRHQVAIRQVQLAAMQTYART